ncbi:MAG: dihydrofolate reductase [Rhodospirillaceae bacterium]|nr:dihydrofolate reductase [Rhodospirillaceae bacterium]
MTRDIVVSLIVARAENGVIGAGGKLPWHISADLKHFKALTVGKPVVMGRKTYESIGKPLPRRTNIVITRDPNWRAEGVVVAHDLATALALAYEDAHRTGVDEVMIIGGAEIYAQALPHAKRIHLTEIHRDYAGDTRLALNLAGWQERDRVTHAPETPGGPAFSFTTLERG